VRGAPANVVSVALFALAASAGGACDSGDAPAPSPAFGPAPPTVDAGRPAPTWFRDVEPIVQVECAGCHAADGTGGFPLDQATTTSLASLVAERVSARDMPPWPPARGGASIASSRMLDDADVATITTWAAAGAPAGNPVDHVERSPRVFAVPPRAPDLRLAMSSADAYQQPSNQFVTDEIRCFVLDLPASSVGVWVTAARWRAGTPVGVHNLGGVVLDATAAVAARARSHRDGRAGFECGGGLGDVERSGRPSLAANGTGGAFDGATILPPAAAVRIPAGGAVLMRAHYAVKHLSNASDRSGVDLWLADTSRVRPLVTAAVSAPVEVPCPSGVSLDPGNPCSRDNAFARLAPGDPSAARARADALLATCGTTLEAAARATGDADHSFVTTSCTSVAPFDGTIRVVDAHMQTRGASVRVESEQGDGSWKVVLDIPRWRWAWEGAYLLDGGVPVRAGKRLRVSCRFDNGASNQWSALTGEPGHDAPARPPLLAPGYLVAAPHRAAEACTAYLGIERAPYHDAAWPTVCHEAQALHGDTCSGAIDLVSRGCIPADEDASVAILSAPTQELRCAPR
jgi:hypothetical protein